MSLFMSLLLSCFLGATISRSSGVSTFWVSRAYDVSTQTYTGRSDGSLDDSRSPSVSP
jgi:hypothetical protein